MARELKGQLEGREEVTVLLLLYIEVIVVQDAEDTVSLLA